MSKRDNTVSLFTKEIDFEERKGTIVWKVVEKKQIKSAGTIIVRVPENIKEIEYWSQAFVLHHLCFKGYISANDSFNDMKIRFGNMKVESNCIYLVDHLNEGKEVLRRDGGFTRSVKMFYNGLTAIRVLNNEWHHEVYEEFPIREADSVYDINSQLEPVTINIRGIGNCIINPHTLDRYLEFKEFTKEYKGLEKFPIVAMKKEFSSPWKEVRFPKSVEKAKMKKYGGKGARYYLKSGDSLFLTIRPIEGDEDLYIIKTLFWMNPELGLSI